MVYATKVMQLGQEITPVMDGDNLSYLQYENTYYAEFECDTEQDLPDKVVNVDLTDAKGNINLIMGSKAHCIDTNKEYKMKSDGTWVEQDEASRMDVYTTSQVNQLLEDMADAQENIDLDQDAQINRNADLLADLIDNGAKNRLSITATSTTTNGIAITINSDGTVTMDGVNLDKKATGAIFFQLGNMDISNGESVHLSGCPSGGSYSSGYAFYIDYAGGSTLAYDEGNGATYTSNADRTIRCRIIIRSGTVIDNLTFSPMVCLNDAYEISDKFVPYCPSLKDLYAMVKSYHP